MDFGEWLAEQVTKADEEARKAARGNDKDFEYLEGFYEALMLVEIKYKAMQLGLRR